MSDERLRDLERLAAQGDPEAQAKLLLERVRIKDLDREMLRLAAVLEHSPALTALRSLQQQCPRQDPHLINQWVDEILAPFGHTVIRRATIAIARLVLPICEGYAPDYDWARMAIVSCEQYITTLSHADSDLLTTIDQASYNLTELAMRLIHINQDPAHQAIRAIDCIRSATLSISSKHVGPEAWLIESLDKGCQALSAHPGDSGTETLTENLKKAMQTIHCAISEELIPWALGLRDPLLDNPTPPERPDSTGTD